MYYLQARSFSFLWCNFGFGWITFDVLFLCSIFPWRCYWFNYVDVSYAFTFRIRVLFVPFSVFPFVASLSCVFCSVFLCCIWLTLVVELNPTKNSGCCVRQTWNVATSCGSAWGVACALRFPFFYAVILRQKDGKGVWKTRRA